MGFVKYVRLCERIPKGYGVAYRRWDRNEAICLPLGINKIVSWWMDFYRWLSRDSRYLQYLLVDKMAKYITKAWADKDIRQAILRINKEEEFGHLVTDKEVGEEIMKQTHENKGHMRFHGVKIKYKSTLEE